MFRFFFPPPSYAELALLAAVVLLALVFNAFSPPWRAWMCLVAVLFGSGGAVWPRFRTAVRLPIVLLATLGLGGQLALSGCSTSAMNNFNNGLTTTTTNLVALDNALVQVSTTIINNFVAQQKLLAPYNCGAYALASAIVQGSPAASTVNAYLTKQVAAGVANVAVADICSQLGYPTTVTAPAGTPTTATATS